MTNEALGISIGLSLRGIGSLGTLSSSLNSLKNTLTDVKNGFKDVEVRTKTLSSLKIDQGNLKDQLSTINNLIRGGIAYGGVKVAMDFESAMADVKKVVDFTSEVDFQNFSNELLNLSRTIPLSAQELATITASGGQLGIAKDELMDYTKIVAKMGVAFDMSASMAGESIATLKNVLNLSMSEVENLGDTINHLSDNSAAKASAIVETISRVGGVAKVFKLSADQTAALSSSFIALGKSPEVASTAINALLNKMMTAPQQGAKFQEALNQIGIDSQYMKVAIQHNPQKALEQFLSMLEGVKDSEKMGVLTNLFGTEYADDMALLTSSLDEYKKAIKLVNDEGKNGSMDNEFENRSKTTANALVLLKNSASEVGIVLGSVLLPAVSGIMRTLSGFLAGILDIANKVPGLTTVISYATTAFLLFKPAVIATKLAFSYTASSALMFAGVLGKISAIKTLLVVKITSFNFAIALASLRLKTAIVASILYSKSMMFLRTSLFSVAGALKIVRLALISTGIGALVVLAGTLIANWDKVKEYLSAFGAWLSGLFEPIITPIREIFGSFFSWIGEKFSWVGDLSNTLVGSIGKIGSIFGFGNESVGDENSINTTPLFDFTPAQPISAVLATPATNQNITVNLSGDFNISNNNGSFDFEEFKQTLVDSVKRALRQDELNSVNRSYHGS